MRQHRRKRKQGDGALHVVEAETDYVPDTVIPSVFAGQKTTARMKAPRGRLGEGFCLRSQCGIPDGATSRLRLSCRLSPCCIDRRRDGWSFGYSWRRRPLRSYRAHSSYGLDIRSIQGKASATEEKGLSCSTDRTKKGLRVQRANESGTNQLAPPHDLFSKGKKRKRPPVFPWSAVS